MGQEQLLTKERRRRRIASGDNTKICCIRKGPYATPGGLDQSADLTTKVDG